MDITTRLIGSGHYHNGSVIVWPVVPWVVYDGTYTRPTAKRFRIVNQALQELDGTPAVLPPSYVPSGVLGTTIYPDEGYYGIEIFQNGRRAYKGFLRVPYDPTDQGVVWFDFSPAPERPEYGQSLYPLDPVPEQGDALPGTIVFGTDSVFYGRTISGWVPLSDADGFAGAREGMVLTDTLSAGLLVMGTEGIRFGDLVTEDVREAATGSLADRWWFSDAVSSAGDTEGLLTEELLLGIAAIDTRWGSPFEVEGLVLSDALFAADDLSGMLSEGLRLGSNLGVRATQLVGIADGWFGAEDMTTTTTEEFAGERFYLSDSLGDTPPAPSGAWYVQDWDYGSVSEMLADPALSSAGTNGGQLHLLQDANGPGFDRAMRVEFYANAGDEPQVGVNIAFPDAAIDNPREIWIEYYARFSSNWVVVGEHKQLFLFDQEQSAIGRWEHMVGLWNNKISMQIGGSRGPGDTARPYSPDFYALWDGNWHRFRYHARMDSTNGVWDCEVDDQLFNWGTGNTDRGSHLYFTHMALSRNISQGTDRNMTLDFGPVAVYNEDPGW